MRYLFTVLSIVCFSFLSFSQTGSLRGNVYEQESQSTIPFAVIQIKSLNISVAANNDGYFQILDIPVGTYNVEVSFIGFGTVTKSIQIKKESFVFEKFYLVQESTVLDDVIINVQRQKEQKKVLTSVVTLSAKRIQTFSIGGEPDLIRAIQVLPGVVTTGDQGGQLYIRGGAPIQNLTMLDGMILYNPFHSIGFFSVFDTDILQSADVYTAGFNAKYGSRTSSVMDIRTRVGNRSRVAGKVSASTYMAKALLEIPIGVKDENGLAPTSLMISAKTSYLQESAKIFYPYVVTEYGGLPFNFTDIFGKFSYQSNNGSELNLFGFNFTDGVQFDANKGIDWNSYGGAANFRIIPGKSSNIISGRFAYSKYDINSTEVENRPRSSSIAGFNGGLDFTYFLRKNDELVWGIDMIGYQTDFLFTNGVGRELKQNNNTTEFGLYSQYKMQFGRWLIEPGIRGHYYSSVGALRIEPRLGLKFNASEFFRIKFAGGLYSQNLVAANSDRDVVNLFYGFLSSPENTTTTLHGEEINNSLQKARHAVLGFEYDITERISMNLEGYVKDFQTLVNVNRNKIYDDNANYLDKPEYLKKDFIMESGLAYGTDVTLKYDDGSFYVWAVYSLSKVTRDDDVLVYSPQYDRRHNLNLVVSYKWGTDKHWEFNTRWNYGSGFPFTPIQGYYSNLPFTTSGGSPTLQYPYLTQNGQAGVLYGELNSQRLPDYHRMDITLKRTWKLGKYSVMDASLAVTNVYNRENIFYYNTFNAKRVNQLPIMPSLIMSYSF